MYENIRKNFVARFTEARKRTLQIFELAEESALQQSPAFGFRPILWHLAHLGVFEEYWLLQHLNQQNPINERFQIIFDPIRTPRESSVNLPSKAEMLVYLDEVREKVFRVLEIADFDSKNRLLRNGYIFELVYQHELQHQETLAYLFHLLPLDKIQKTKLEVRNQPETSKSEARKTNIVEFAGIEMKIGFADKNQFCYDNEIPVHTRFVSGFKLGNFLTTNGEFAEFIAERGYERREFWSEEGWNFKEKENWRHPLYWQESGNDWLIRTFSKENSLSDFENYPVYGVSF